MATNGDGACALLLDLPPAAFCGIDLLSFTTSPRFVGIKHIPPGWHFIFVGANTSFSLRHGIWFYVEDNLDPRPGLALFQWDARNEVLSTVQDASVISKWRTNLASVWRDGLTPYRQTVVQADTAEDGIVEERRDWPKLTDKITKRLLHRITKIGEGEHIHLDSASSANQDFDDIPGLSKEETALGYQHVLGFLPIELKQTWREGAIGRERTDAAQDRSWALTNIAEKADGGLDEIIGEFQMSFVMVLTLNNNSCLEQWKRILNLVLTCRAATQTHPGFFVSFLVTLKLQLQHCDDAEAGLLDLSDEAGNLLRHLLRRFRQGLEQCSGPGKEEVLDELDELEDYLREKHGWLVNESIVRRGMIDLEDGERVEMDMPNVDEEDEMGDYAPVMVDLTPEQARDLGINQGDSSQMEIPYRPSAAKRHNGAENQSTRANVVQEDDEESDLEAMDERY